MLVKWWERPCNPSRRSAVLRVEPLSCCFSSSGQKLEVKRHLAGRTQNQEVWRQAAKPGKQSEGSRWPKRRKEMFLNNACICPAGQQSYQLANAIKGDLHFNLYFMYGNISCGSHRSLLLSPKVSIRIVWISAGKFLAYKGEGWRNAALFHKSFSITRFLIFLTLSRNKTDIFCSAEPAGCVENISKSATNLWVFFPDVC